MNEGPSFPPLLTGQQTAPGQDPFVRAVAQAALGTDAGLVCWSPDTAKLQAAVVFAPEEPLADAITVTFAVALGLGDAIGALAPPEVAVHYVWPRGIKINGANCGFLRVSASSKEPSETPDWLVVRIEMPFINDAANPGSTPDQTCLIEEGCGEITPEQLLESWSRHMLTWINRRDQDGLAPLHAEWRSRCWGMGEPLPETAEIGSGTFMGLDERAGMLVKRDNDTLLVPLTEALE